MAMHPLTLLYSTLLFGCPASDPPPPRKQPRVIQDPEPVDEADGSVDFVGTLKVEGGEAWLIQPDGTRADLAGIEDMALWKSRRDRQVTVHGRVDVDTTPSEMVVRVEGEPRTHRAQPGEFAPVRDEAAWLGKAGGGRRFVLTPLQGPLGPGHPVLVGFIAVDGERVIASVVDDRGAVRHPIEQGWALFKPIGVVAENADDDIDLELVFLADWVKDESPGATVIQRHNIVLDYDGTELRQLPDVEEALAEAQTPAEIRRVLSELRSAPAAKDNDDGAAPGDGGSAG
ncbi:MAG: hypothetical protein H6742_15440 [Alphaproteobacteria bacterium]|nr:hypothetical protein [Alphaproteobacteria bacterium]